MPASHCHDPHAQHENDSTESLAIVGMALRLPGGVNTPDSLWDLLMNKKDGHCRVPSSRYNVDAFYHPTRAGSVRTQHGYFLPEDPTYFDNRFFAIPSLEAARLDPQQRLLLEVIWECMESAGQTQWRGTKIGCFVGVFGEDWLDLNSKDTQRIDRYHVLGTGDFALSNRISYEFDLTGPSMTLETGCSSSLIALHMACTAILNQTCPSAIIAGANLILSPTMTTTMSDNMVLSPSGICRTFSATADGYGRAEGVNALYVKRLSDAIRDGDPIRAVIRATATNCDGKTPVITTPGSITQKELILEAYQRAGVREISETGYFECHGTGTVMGDTAELSVVGDLFAGKGVVVGSVKPNLGHSEGASGITSVIKTALALEKRVIPPNIYFDEPNPKIPFEECGLVVPVNEMVWPSGKELRASVNCFGIGGANAHVILEAGTLVAEPKPSYLIPISSRKLLVLSAASPEALEQRVVDLQEFMAHHEAPPLGDIAYTLGARREHLKYRTFAIASDQTPTLFSKECAVIESSTSPKIILVFTGQGAQWAGMGRELLGRYESFKCDIQTMDSVLRGVNGGLPWSIEGILNDTSPELVSRINDPELSQPVCTAIQIALVNILAQYGIQASEVVGHSSGEIAAAYAAGALPLSTAILLAYYRGQCTRETEDGAMAAIGLGRKEVEPWLLQGAVIACNNSPSSTTVSGDRTAVIQTLKNIRTAYPDIFSRELRVTKAYHSHHMSSVAKKYESAIAPHMCLSSDMLPLYSTVSGDRVTEPESLNETYWTRNLTSTVEFTKAIENILDSATRSNRIFIEVGPHSTLNGPLRQIFESTERRTQNWYIPTLIRTQDAEVSLLRSIGTAFARGAQINLLSINGPGSVITNLPRYPWQHSESLICESRLSENWRFRKFPHHELLGARVLESSELEPSWRNVLQIQNCSWLCHHKLYKDTVFPCAGYIALIGEAIRQHRGGEAYEIRNLVLKKTLFLPELSPVEIITTLKPARLSDIAESEWFDFTIVALEGGEWAKYSQGQVRVTSECSHKVEQQEKWTRQVDQSAWYQFMARLGLNYGKRFQLLQDITVDPLEHVANGWVTDDERDHESHYLVHPTVIDQSLQILSVAATNGLARRVTKLVIPASIGSIYIARGAGSLCIQGLSDGDTTSTTMTGSASILCGNVPVLVIKGATFFSLSEDQTSDEEKPIPLLSELEWGECLDLVPPARWLTFEPVDKGVPLLAELTALYIIECAPLVADLIPATEEVANYQRWLLKKRAAIVEGREQRFLTIPWHKMSNADKATRTKVLQEQISCHGEGPHKIATILRRVFDHCVPLIQGQSTPLEILTMDHLTDFYNFSSSLSDWRCFLSLVRHWNPRVRVLEVGAGTGATCAQVVDLLQSEDGVPMCSLYTYTDISSVFFSRAAERFKRCKFMEYKTLDISRSPLDQGFAAGSYDLVVVSNAVHTTSSLSRSLSNIRQLLVPGGYLLLQELCPSILTVDFIVGILPDWWNRDYDERGECPYVSPIRWNDELLTAGFTGAESVTLDNKKPFQVNANIISRNPVVMSPKRGVTFLVGDATTSPWQEDLESGFVQHGCTTNRATLNEIDSFGDFSSQCIISLLDITEASLDHMTEERFGKIKYLFSLSSKVPIIWITLSTQTTCVDPRFSLVLGLARTLRREIVGNIVTIELDTFNATRYQAIVDIYQRTMQAATHSTSLRDTEYVVLGQKIFVSRFHWRELKKQIEHIPDPTATRCLSVDRYGLLDTLNWRAVSACEPALGVGQLEVDIQYVGLNFRDLMVALGVMGEMDQCGLEASGTVRRVGSNITEFRVGDKVAVCGEGMFRTRTCVDEHRCIRVPPELSLSDAATLPAVYATAVYSLITVGQLEKGQTVLIHCASGGVGIAAIQICQAIGATIYATAGSKEKRDYLHTEFQIPISNIFNSRDDSFLADLMAHTNGVGVDLVLNSLAGSLLHASWSCVAPYGKMIELGKRDFLAHGTLRMNPFQGNRSFIGVDMMGLMQEKKNISKDLLTTFLNWYKEGKIRPIRPITVFNAGDVGEAFNYMQSGKHMGKIIVEMSPPSGLNHIPTRPNRRPVMISPSKSYLLVGGLGGIGRAVSNWLAENGAKHLIFLSRSAGQSPDHDSFMLQLRRQGCLTTMVAGDVANPDDVAQAISKADGRLLGGVLHLSMVLRDESFAKMTYVQWQETYQPKVTGTWNLHSALAKHESNLDFFVLFSSMASLVGTVGQSNYAAANSFLDSFAQYRRQNGLVASVLNLGIVEDVGCVHRDLAVLNRAKFTGARLIREGTVVDALHAAILRSKTQDLGDEKCEHDPLPVSGVMAIGVNSTKPLSAPGVTPLWATTDIRFSIYENLEGNTGGIVETVDEDLQAFFADIEDNPVLLDDPATEGRIMKELCGLITAHMSHEGVREEEVADIPIDSLMAIEIRNWFRRKLGIEITLTEISKAGTVGGLSRVTIATLKGRYLQHEEQPGAPADH